MHNATTPRPSPRTGFSSRVDWWTGSGISREIALIGHDHAAIGVSCDGRGEILSLTEVVFMHHSYFPETQRAHDRLCEQTAFFINCGGKIEQIPPGVSGSAAGKPKAQWSVRTARP